MDSKIIKRNISILPNHLIIYISKIILGTNNKLIFTTHKKSLLALIHTFRICRQHYVGSDGIFNIYHYLWIHSKKYYDVRILAHQYGLHVEQKWPITNKICSVTYLYNIPGDVPIAGKFYTSLNKHCTIFLHDLSSRYSPVFGDLYMYIEDNLLNLNIHESAFDMINIWNGIIFDNSGFQFLHQKLEMFINLKKLICIKPALTIDKFKELINEREGRKVF